MYVNPSSDHFDSHRQYAFLRATDDERILVCVNFDDAPHDIRLRIPSHAFDYLGIPKEGIRTGHVSICPDEDVPLHLPASDGVILKF